MFVRMGITFTLRKNGGYRTSHLGSSYVGRFLWSGRLGGWWKCRCLAKFENCVTNLLNCFSNVWIDFWHCYHCNKRSMPSFSSGLQGFFRCVFPRSHSFPCQLSSTILLKCCLSVCPSILIWCHADISVISAWINLGLVSCDSCGLWHKQVCFYKYVSALCWAHECLKGTTVAPFCLA